MAFTIAILAACLAASAGWTAAALARGPHPPSSSDSDVPCGIALVGTTGGVADVRGQFTIIIRNAAQEPVAGAEVVIDFSGCAPDIRISEVQPWPGISIDCTAPVGIVRAVTDANGTVKLRIVGGANNVASGTPASPFRCASVYADGVEIGGMTVAAFDQNGAGGVNPADVSVWLPDSFDADYEGRSDYNCSNTINPADLALLRGASFGSGSLQSAASYCH